MAQNLKLLAAFPEDLPSFCSHLWQVSQNPEILAPKESGTHTHAHTHTDLLKSLTKMLKKMIAWQLDL